MSTKLRYGTPEQAGMDPRRIEHVKDLALGGVEDGITPSLVVLAARRDLRWSGGTDCIWSSR